MDRLAKPAKLDKRLVLNEWLFRQLGYIDTETGMKQLSRILRDVTAGWDEQNIFYFRNQLEESLPEKQAITNDLLAEYDRNIFDHWQRITKKRAIKEHREMFPLYFQYLALLFTEYYLDRWSRDRQQHTTALLDELNKFCKKFNYHFPGKSGRLNRIALFEENELSKLAFWIATGGGKTLIMHCNICQSDYYLKKRNLRRYFNKYILITPNQGLTEQHLGEFILSGIPAERFQKDNTYYDMYNKNIVEVIEITKLKDKSGVTTVDVAQFGKNNVVMVDEGHRGSGGDEWFHKRQQLCENGFSFEYSATFGQSVSALSGKKQKEMGMLYAKSVLFDYSYKFFFGDGYGKDFHIINYSQENPDVINDLHKLYLTACLLRFYQQCRLYKDKRSKYASYLVDDPLLVFVGGSVTGKREKKRDTDVVTALKFLAGFIADQNASIARLDLLLKKRDELRDSGGLVFDNAFDYVRNLFPVTEPESALKLFKDMIRIVFNSSAKGLLHAVYLKGSGNEIGLRVGENSAYFGVINIGEPKKLWKMLEELHGDNIVCTQQQFSISLFDNIKSPESKIRLLIGAKKFTEGWNCWRVSGMGLINIGRKEGSQIIQLFGRGVRLKGLDFCLKRSGQLNHADHPEYIKELETLNVFGIRADYMQAFNEYIDEEGVDSEKKTEIICLPTIENLARTDLKVILPQKDMPDFKKEVKPVFKRESKIRTKITADWYGRLDSKTRRDDLLTDDENIFNKTALKPENLKFLDHNRLYLDIIHYKKQNAMYNLEINRDSITDLLSQTDWYDLFIPEYMLAFTGFDKVRIWQEIAADLLKRYCKKYYHFKKDEFEGPYQEYRTIQEILDSPEDRHNQQFLQNLRFEYSVAIEKSQDQLINSLKKIGKKLKAGELAGFEFSALSIFNFEHHLYHPLIHVKKGSVGIHIQPTHLNQHERQFIMDMKAWCKKEKDTFLEKKELYVLRNRSKGKGVSFFDEGNFYPDFILWLISGNHQYITFADPHGLQHARSFSDSKILFSARIKEIERERLKDDSVTLNSFIISPTRFNDIKHWHGGTSKDKFHEHHVFFMYDEVETYIQSIFNRMTG
jgi:hypothetical protein